MDAQEKPEQQVEPIVGNFPVRIDLVTVAKNNQGTEYLRLFLSLEDGRETRLRIYPSWKGRLTREFETLLASLRLPVTADFDEKALVGKTVLAYLTETTEGGKRWQRVREFRPNPMPFQGSQTTERA